MDRELDALRLKKEKRRSRFKTVLNFLALVAILLLVGVICYLLQADQIINVQIDREALLDKLGRRGKPTLAISTGQADDVVLSQETNLDQGDAGAGNNAEPGNTQPVEANVVQFGENIGVSDQPAPSIEDRSANHQTAPQYLSTLPLDQCLDFAEYTRPEDEQPLGGGWYTMRHYQALVAAAGLLASSEELVENGTVIAIRKPDGSFFHLQRGLGLKNDKFHWCPKNFGGGDNPAVAIAQSSGDLRLPLEAAPTVRPLSTPAASTLPPTSTPSLTPSPSATWTPPPTSTPSPTATWTPPPTSTPTATFYPTTVYPTATQTPPASPTSTPSPVTTSTHSPTPPPTFDPRTPTPFASGCPKVLVVADGVQIGETVYPIPGFTSIFNDSTGGDYTIVSDGDFLTAHDISDLNDEDRRGPGWVIFTLPEGGVRFLEQNYCLQPDL